VGSFYFSLLLSPQSGKDFLSSTFHEYLAPSGGDESRTFNKVREEGFLKKSFQ